MRALLQFLVVLIPGAIGVSAFVYGEVDDSPGLMLLGVLFVAGAIWLGVRSARRGWRRT